MQCSSLKCEPVSWIWPDMPSRERKHRNVKCRKITRCTFLALGAKSKSAHQYKNRPLRHEGTKNPAGSPCFLDSPCGSCGPCDVSCKCYCQVRVEEWESSQSQRDRSSASCKRNSAILTPGVGWPWTSFAFVKIVCQPPGRWVPSLQGRVSIKLGQVQVDSCVCHFTV